MRALKEFGGRVAWVHGDDDDAVEVRRTMSVKRLFRCNRKILRDLERKDGLYLVGLYLSSNQLPGKLPKPYVERGVSES